MRRLSESEGAILNIHVEAANAMRNSLLILLTQTYGFKRGDAETFLTLFEAWMRAEINAGITAYSKAGTLPDH